MRSFVLLSALLLSGCLFAGSGTPAPLDSGTSPGDDAALPDNNAADGGTLPDVDPNNVVPATCGDGALQPGEKCDPMMLPPSPGACPESCDDGIACTADSMLGSPETCDAACASTPITDCDGGDGCCPAGCTNGNDSDCPVDEICGDGVRSGAELCDVNIDSGEGACPTDPAACPVMECGRATISGSGCMAICSYTTITSCTQDADGCCPMGCTANNDADCEPMCGNGAIEFAELCDGNCPTELGCDDGDACTTESVRGSAASCDAACAYDDIVACVDADGCCPIGCTSNDDDDCSATCGDGNLDPGETCDGDCPTSCAPANSCTTATLVGSASNCNAACATTTITGCFLATDGCCPPACDANNDGDCTAICGNDITEPGEVCDGNCPTTGDCDDGNACTTDGINDANTCNAVCYNNPVTACAPNDGCCPAGCNATNDSDCQPVCGNGVKEGAETCDGDCPSTCEDGNACTLNVRTGNAGSCNVVCGSSPVLSCVDNDQCCPSACNANNDSDCGATCGNNSTEGDETCDGDCPEPGECGPCEVYSGSASTCDAQCVTDSSCQLCSAAACGCAVNDICSQGVCTDSSGADCALACEPDEYCNAAVGGVCVSGNCVDCRANGDCSNGETCIENDCIFVDSCGDVPNGDQWCVDEGKGNKCVDDDCYASCSQSNLCSCPDPVNQYCTNISGATVCLEATYCGVVCGPQQDQFCIDRNRGTCTGSGGGDQCSG